MLENVCGVTLNEKYEKGCLMEWWNEEVKEDVDEKKAYNRIIALKNQDG